jgi:inorganic pyrophosphatase
MSVPLYRAHPWHGISAGQDAPSVVTCFVEIVPTDTVKYEIDKESGHLKVDRPQKYSNLCPMPYGFIPQTLCDKLVAERAMQVSGKTGIVGDGDALDICVLAERPFNHGGILLTARVIGGLCMIDRNEADDKIIAVLKDDAAFGDIDDISHAPHALIDRLRHYFLTYKEIPGHTGPPRCEIAALYGKQPALDVITRSQRDYANRYAKS